jgi:hypothetical protein
MGLGTTASSSIEGAVLPQSFVRPSPCKSGKNELPMVKADYPLKKVG